MEVLLISLIIFLIFASFILGKYFGVIQEKRRYYYESKYFALPTLEMYKDEIYDEVGNDHTTFNQTDGNVVSIYFSKSDFIDDLIDNKIIFSTEENKYIKVRKDE